MDNQIAATILRQIGGKRFVAMTGSHNFINLGNGLRMKIGRASCRERVWYLV